MKHLIWLCFLCQIAFAMQTPERTIGNQLHPFDKNNMISIDYDRQVAECEIVAVNTNGKWVYGWVQSKPDMSSGIWLGVVNWMHPVNDTFRGQAKNFSHSVKKLPSLEKFKAPKTE